MPPILLATKSIVLVRKALEISDHRKVRAIRSIIRKMSGPGDTPLQVGNDFVLQSTKSYDILLQLLRRRSSAGLKELDLHELTLSDTSSEVTESGSSCELSPYLFIICS